MVGLLLISGALTLTFWWASRRGRARGALASIVWLLLLALLGAPPVIWVNLLVVGIVAAVCAPGKMGSVRTGLLCLLATVTVYGAFGAKYVSRYHELSTLRDEYPPVSVSARLAYEIAGRERSAGDREVTTASARSNGEEDQLAQSVAGEVGRLEAKLSTWDESDWRIKRRARALETLNDIHERLVTEFTFAQGFGVTRARLMHVGRESVELPELPSLTVPENLEPSLDEPPSAVVDQPKEVAHAGRENAVAPAEDALRTLHEGGVFDFANRDGFGFIASRDRVIGFQPHGFRSQPELPGARDQSAEWRITNLELVSLLKHEPPAAYVSKSLPRMDELAEAPTRPLDTFETNAAEKLREGEELIVEMNGDALTMLGSLRAANQCTECHSVNRGDLLGAFSYRLRRDAPARRKPQPASKPVT